MRFSISTAFLLSVVLVNAAPSILESTNLDIRQVGAAAPIEHVVLKRTEEMADALESLPDEAAAEGSATDVDELTDEYNTMESEPDQALETASDDAMLNDDGTSEEDPYVVTPGDELNPSSAFLSTVSSTLIALTAAGSLFALA